MKKIFSIAALVVGITMLMLSCAKQEFDTNQVPVTTDVALTSYGPRPVVRGGVLRFVGANLDQVVSVTIPGCEPITEIEVVRAGVPSEIHVTVPKDGAEVGNVVLTTKAGKTIETATPLSYIETIVLDKVTPEAAYPGEEITLEGDYLNLIHEVIFSNKLYVSEDDFISHSRYSVKVRVPAEAKTGKVGVGTIDETKVEDEDILAALNVVEIDFTVLTAEGKVSGEYKAGATIDITGNHLSLTKKVFVGKIEIESPVITDSKISFVLPANAADSDVILVMASGVEVVAGSITTVVPTGLSVAPAPVKNGAALTISGNDLDLVTGVDFPNAAGVEFALAEGKITATVPENAQEGDIILTQANGKSVAVAYTLVKPAVTGFSANPASAGSDVTIEGTDLDLVSAVTFGGDIKVDVEATATAITVAVPTAAETGVLVLNLKNGASLETIELAIDKPAGAYIAEFPDTVFSPGDMLIVDVENSDHLQDVLIDDVSVNYILNDGRLYLVIPSDAKAGSTITLQSDNGSVTYTLNIDPGTEAVYILFQGSEDVGSWGPQPYVGEFGGLIKYGAVPGDVVRFYITPKSDDFKLQIFGGNWGDMLAEVSSANSVEGVFDIELTEELITKLNGLENWGGLFVIQGQNCILTQINLIHYIPQETVIFEGPIALTWGDDGRFGLALSYFENLAPGSKLVFYFTQTENWGQVQINDGWWANGDMNFPEIGGAYINTDNVGGKDVTRLALTLTNDILSHLKATAGDYFGMNTNYVGDGRVAIVVQGSDWIIDKISVEYIVK